MREQLHSFLQQPTIWTDDSFINAHARDALICIKYLAETGDKLEDFEPFVRRLAEHECEHNRRHFQGHLAKHFPGLNDSVTLDSNRRPGND